MNVFDLYAKISLDTSEYESGLEGAGSETESFGSKLKSGLGTAAKAVAAGIAAVGTAAVAIGKSSLTAYSSYEQLVGGVETLFQESAGTVQEYAESAYRTAGLSANEYMETVTAFSASLLQGLGGDTQQAAEMANMAIVDMSDNANKMGSDMTSIQNAYQGFAKQNYTMLDNLKLGYGGTQEEMVRLINDSGILNETISDLDGITFDQIVQAIHEVQTQMGITGTTALEADTTIQGSVASMKSAWENLKIGIADENADIGALVDNLVDSVGTSASNIVPRIGVILDGLGETVTAFAGKLWSDIDSAISNSKFGESWDSIKDAASDAFDKIEEAGGKLVDAFSPITDKIAELKSKFDEYAESGQLMDDITAGITTAIDGLATGISTVVTGIADFVGWLTSGSAGASAFQAAVIGIVGAYTAYEIATTAVAAAQTVMHGAQTLVTAGQTALNAVMNANPFVLVATLIAGLVAALIYLWNTNDGFREAVTTAWESIKSVAETVWNAVAGFFTDTIPNAINTALDFFDNLMNGSTEDMNAIEQIVSTVLNNIKTIFETVTGAIKGIVSAFTSALNGDWDGAMNALKDTASTIWEGIKTVIGNKIDLVKSLVSDGLDAVKGYFSEKLESARETAAGIFDSIKTAISDKINAAKDAVSSAIEKIKGFFDFEWSLPPLKLPHISISGSFSLNPPSAPSFGIEWYKKAMDTPYLLSGATIFGAMGGNLLGGGESGSEIVAGTDTLMGMIREATGGGNEEELSLLRRIAEGVNQGGTVINLMAPDGTKFASWLFNPLTQYAKANGTPIINTT